MVTVGAIIMLACIGYLTVTWWRDERWLWVALGVALIVVNIALVFLTYRKARLAPTPDPTKKRRGLIDNFDDLDD